MNLRFIMLARVAGLILLLFLFLSKLYELPTVITALLSFVWILFVPHFVGTIFLKIPFGYMKKLHFGVLNLGISGIIIKWYIGLLLITVTVYISFIFQWGIVNILGPLLLLSGIVYILNLRDTTLVLYQKLVLGLNNNHFRIILILVLLGITFGYYIRSFTPYPLSPGFDVFTHMFVINSILNDSFSNIPLLYFPTWDIIIALGSTTFNADLNSIFWMGPFLLTPLFALSCYLMIYYFLKNQSVAILGTVICLPLTEQGLVPSMQVLYPTSMIMSIFPLMVFVIDFIWKKQYGYSSKIVFTFIIYSGLIIIHPMLGGIAALMLSLYISFAFYFSKKENLFFLLRLLSIVLSLILFLYYYEILTIQILTQNIFSGNLFGSEHLYETLTKLMHLEQFYTEVIMTLGIFGFIILSFHKNKKIVALNLIGIILLLIYFQQLVYIHRILALERPLIILAATFVITLPFLIFSSKIRLSTFFNRKKIKVSFYTESSKDQVNPININSIQKPLSNKIRSFTLINKLGFIPLYEKNTALLIVYILVVFIISFPILMTPFDFYVKIYIENGHYFASYTPDVLSASEWINEYIPSNFKIYSDPQTVVELRGLANRINIEAIGWNTTVADEVKSVFQSENPAYAHQSILLNHGPDIAIVITPKTTEWIDSDEFFITLPITDFKNFDGLNKFYNKNYFNLDYNRNNILIFTLR